MRSSAAAARLEPIHEASGDQHSAVTELTRANEELRCTNADLQRSHAELEQFVWMASHDLKEPLRMVGIWLELLERRGSSNFDDEGAEYLRGAIGAAGRMRRLIDDLLGFATLGAHKISLQCVNAETAVTCALANLDAAVRESGAEIECAAMPDVLADAGLLTNVFQNLIGNALKFRAAEAPRIHIGVRENTAGWVFSVRDNGIGISPDHQDRVFHIFERLHPADEYPGNGIGLATVKKIVERHGGQVWVESELGNGSTFYFAIPKL